MPRLSMTTQRYEDLLLIDESTTPRRRKLGARRSGRSQSLEVVLNAIGNMFLSPKAPVMASFVAGKVFQRIHQPAVCYDEPEVSPEVNEHISRAIANAANALPQFKQAATNLADLKTRLRWRASRTGPFASLKFEQSHAHAILVGPGGLEERSDVRVGMTLMAPYSRFPDHVQLHSRAFLLLSDGEVCFDLSNWIRAKAGTIFFNEAGRCFAMRCTSEPLLAVWCQVETQSI